MDTNKKQQVDSGGNQDKPSTEVSEELDLDSFKDDLAPGLFTLGETPKPNYKAPLSLPIDLKESLSPPVKSLNTSAIKKLYYIIVPAKKAELKKKIVGNIKG